MKSTFQAIVALVAIIVGTCLINMASQADDAAPIQVQEITAELRDLIATISIHHVHHPSEVSLIAEAIEFCAQQQHESVPPKLRATLEAMQNSNDRWEFMQAELEKHFHGASLPAAEAKEFVAKFLEQIPEVGEVISAKDAAVAEQLLANRYVGIGVRLTISQHLDYPVFEEAMEGGTASEAGIIQGDVLISVDGRSTKGVELGEVVQWLRGPENSQVEVEVQTINASPRTVTMTRRVVPLATIKQHNLGEYGKADFAFWQCDSIASSCVSELRKLEAQLDPHVETIVIDLRGGRQDSLHNVHLLCDALMNEATVGSVETSDGEQTLRTDEGRLLAKYQVVFLINADSSAYVQWAARALENQGNLVLFENVASKKKLVPLKSIDAKLPANLKRQDAFVSSSVPIENNRGVITLATGKLKDVHGNQQFMLVDSGARYPHTTGDGVGFTYPELIVALRRWNREHSSSNN